MAGDRTPLAELRRAAGSAYAPYSGFRVGAVVEDEDGNLHAGCNVECASIGLSICAERAALGAALARGATRFRRIWVYTPTDAPTPPCGACRELVSAVAPDIVFHLVCDSPASVRRSAAALLPGISPRARRSGARPGARR